MNEAGTAVSMDEEFRCSAEGCEASVMGLDAAARLGWRILDNDTLICRDCWEECH